MCLPRGQFSWYIKAYFSAKNTKITGYLKMYVEILTQHAKI